MAKISEGMQGLMNDFLEAKRSFYGWETQIFKQKADNFRGNIKKVKFQHSRFPGGYHPNKGKLLFDMPGDISGEDVRVVAHELNHVFNHEKGKRVNLISTSKMRSSRKKYEYISEIINEAETSVLFSQPGMEEVGNNPNNQNVRRFYGYRTYESVFKTMCICNNQNAIQFLKGIEGVDINGLVEYFAEHSGHSFEEAKKYIDSLSGKTTLLEKQKKLGIVTREKLPQIRNKMSAYQHIYNISREYIETSSIDDKARQEMLERLSSIQSEIDDNILDSIGLRDNEVRTLFKSQMKIVECPVYEDGAKFEWGRSQHQNKMKQMYMGLHRVKKEKQLQLGSRNDSTYQTPEATTMFESMPDLTKINSDEEISRSYMQIESMIKEKLTRTSQIESQSYSAPTR